MRMALMAIALAAPLLAGCGCPDDRAPSRIEMALDTPLSGEPHEVSICVDGTCDTFVGVEGATGDYPLGDGMTTLAVREDALVYTTFDQIEAGDHEIVAEVIADEIPISGFEGTVMFEEIDRCHSDSTATVELESTR